MARPAIVVALPPEEQVPVVAELREAGFDAIAIRGPERPRGRSSRLAATSPSRSSTARATSTPRSSTTPCCVTAAGRSRP